MTTNIAVLWWVFLACALLVTLVDVYLLVKVVVLARGIQTLAGETLRAAVGIVGNTAAKEGLMRTLELVGTLVKQTTAVDPLTSRVVRRLTEAGS